MSTYGLCPLSSVPLRAEPSDRSEMVNQVLFGEHFAVLDTQKNWVRIRLSHDSYEGWMDAKQVSPLSEEQFNRFNSAPLITLSNELVDLVIDDSERARFPIWIGSTLPHYEGGKFQLGEDLFGFQGDVVASSQQKELLVENAFMYLHAPYLWGGRTPFGIDCSGFTQMVYRLNGIAIPRDASQQAEIGQIHSFLEECEPGDLAFFDNDEGAIIHVGILLGNNKIIHASGRVRVDRIDQQGIFNVDTGRHTHKLRLLKRIV